MTTFTAAEIVTMLKDVHERYEAPDADQRAAAYWWGQPDDSVAWWLSMCSMVAPDPVAQALYLASVAEDTQHNRKIKTWAYEVAAEIATQPRPGSKRNQPAVAIYDIGWARQAARDGVSLAMWPHLSDCIPGINHRSERFGCRNDAYQYVRDGVCERAKELIGWFHDDMESCRTGRYRRDFIERWEDATMRTWPKK